MSEGIAAVVFDLDGVLIDSESVWDAARREVVARNGGRWQADATRAMMGMSSPEWSRATNKLKNLCQHLHHPIVGPHQI